MCVILIADEDRPSEEMIAKAYAQNSHGAGIAWREAAEDGDGFEVVWKKGLNLEELQELVAAAPLPFVVHCRIASCGGQRKDLTHPFLIDENATTLLEGRTKSDVLFHNGHWGKWKDFSLETAKSFGVPLPPGKYSDTRMMAWCCHLYGKNFMELIDEKGVAFGPEETTLFWGSGWTLIDGVWASNTHFQHNTGFRRTGDPTGAYSGTYSGICKHGPCRNHNVDASGFCPAHRPEVPEVGAARPTQAQLPARTQQQLPVPVTQTPQGGGTLKTGSPQSSVPSSTPTQNSTTRVEEVPASASPFTPSPLTVWNNAQRAFRMGKLSKKALKRARKAYEKSQRALEAQSTQAILIKGTEMPPAGTH